MFDRSFRRGRLLSLALAALLIVVACEEGSSTPRPSASLLEVEFTPRASGPPPSGASAEPTVQPTFVDIPVGWDDAFCELFGETVVAQELVIDVERALEEEAFADARGLARDLRETTGLATEMVADLPEWEPASDVVLEIAALIDLERRAGDAYGTYFETGERTALRRARTLRREVADETPAANELLAGLAGLGIGCSGLELVLEQP